MAVKHGRVEQEALVFNHSASANIWGGEAASNSLIVFESTVESVKVLYVNNQLDLLGAANTNTPELKHIHDIVPFISRAERGGVDYQNLSNYFQIYQSTKKSLAYSGIETSLDLIQNVEVARPIYVNAQNYLGGDYAELDWDELATIDPTDPEQLAALIASVSLRDTLAYQKRHYESVTSYLSPSQEAAVSFDASASNHIHLSQEALYTTYDNPSSQIYFTQTVVADLTDNILQELELTHDVIGSATRDFNMSSTLNITQSLTYTQTNEPQDYIPTPDAPSPSTQTISLCDYAPQIGSTDDTTYTPPSVTPPTLIRRTSTVLTWPYATPSITLEIDNPDFDNVEQFEFRRINRRTRGGTLDFYRDESWIKCKRLIMSFSGLSEIQRNNMLEFLQLSIGTEVGILDFESRQWRGLILTPTTPLEEPGRIGFSFTLEFEGELV